MAGNFGTLDSLSVCSEPKVFAGQIPFESTTQDVQELFSRYGQLRSCQVITAPDGRSRGCAMILFTSWMEAEIAIEKENGKNSLGGSKTMVVKFADPPKRGDGPSAGISPKKLFVGQIPNTFSEEALRGMFAPYGRINDMHMLRKNPGAGCAFVLFDRWSSCEAAIAGLHGKTHLEGAKMPIVVKFADYKSVFTPNFRKKMGAGLGRGMGPFGMGFGMGMGGPMGAMGPYGMGGLGMLGMMGVNGMGGMGGPGMLRGLHKMGVPGAGNTHMQASKLGTGATDETSKQWKLFVGQVPFEANEADLWSVFSVMGNILELVVLRTPQGKSKGCAFVTYETRALAEKAIKQLDGQVCVPDDPKQRLLLVKFASGSGSSPGAAAAALMGQSANMGAGTMTGSSSTYVGVDGPSSGLSGVMNPQANLAAAARQAAHQQAVATDPYSQQMQQMQQMQGIAGMPMSSVGAIPLHQGPGGIAAMGPMPGGMGF